MMPEPNSVCHTCSDKFYKRPNLKEKSEHDFCSMDCYHEHRRENLPTGEEHPLSNRVEVECSECGDSIKVQPHKLESNNNHFCSRGCYEKWRKGRFMGEKHWQWKEDTIYEYGGNWGTQRRKALQRDDASCQICGATKKELGRNPDVHHIKPYRTFEKAEKANELSNLVCLCRSCHIEVERENSPQ